MSDNLGLAQLSDHLLIIAVVVYSLAMLAYAGDFAYGRRVKTASAAGEAARPVPELAGVGASGGAATPETPEPPAAIVPPVATADSAPGDAGRQGPLIRGAIGLTFLGMAIHVAGV